MWLLCGILSVVFCVVGWIMATGKSKFSYLAFACSLVTVPLTLFMEYKLVLDWVNKEDWSALLDVMPFMFWMSAGYVIIMVLVNAVSIIMVGKKQ